MIEEHSQDHDGRQSAEEPLSQLEKFQEQQHDADPEENMNAAGLRRASEDKLPGISTIERRDLLALHENVARGTFAKVSVGLYGGIYVAVKKFKREGNLEHAEWEVEILAKVKHPNISMFIGCDLTRPPYLIITRFVGDPNVQPLTVKAALEQSTFPLLVPFWIRILSQVADALLYLHMNAKVIHNDIKSDNIVLEQSPVNDVGVFNATIVDFGKSSIVGLHARGPSSPITTDAGESHRKRYPHVAPELWRGARSTSSSDMYSYGHLLEEIGAMLHDNTMKSFYVQCKDLDRTKRPSAGSSLVYLNSYKFRW